MLVRLIPGFVFAVLITSLNYSLKANTKQDREEQKTSDFLERARVAERKAFESGDSLQLAEAYRLYGLADLKAGDGYEAQSHFYKALKILEPRGDSYLLGRVYLLLSENHLSYPSSLDQREYYSKQALSLFQRIGSKKDVADTYLRLGNQFALKGLVGAENRVNHDSAYYYYRLSEKISLEIPDSNLVSSAYIFIGELLMSQGDRNCFNYFEKALAYVDKNPKNRKIKTVHIYLHQAMAFIHFGNYPKALEFTEEAEKIYKTLQEKDHLIYSRILIAYHLSFSSFGQYQNAYKYLLLYIDHAIKQNTLEKEKTIIQIREKYETDKKEQLLHAQEEKAAQDRIILLATIGALLLSLAAGYVFFKMYKSKKLLSQLNAELLKEQGHRINNHLQIASDLLAVQSMQVQDTETKNALTDTELRMKSIALIQQQLSESNNTASIFLPQYLSTLITNILTSCGYASIKKEIVIDPVFLDSKKAGSLGLIVNELLTNACKYAFRENDDPLMVLKCQTDDHRLHVVVQDNGPGFDIETRQNSLGLTLIKVLASQLNADYQFLKSEAEKGTIFKLHFVI